MSSSSALYAFYWLIYDTFRQAMASKILWIMLTVTGLCFVFCLGVSIEGGVLERDHFLLFEKEATEPLSGPLQKPGKMRLLFGAFSYDLPRDAEAGIHHLHVVFGSWVAGTVGILFTLIWTAGFIPEFLHPSTSAVLLAKPIPRWLFLAGKYIGVVLFVALQATLFFGLTWLGLGARTGVWLNGYLAGIPLMTFHFALFYSVSVYLGVLTRNTIACVLGTALFWVFAGAVNYGRHSIKVLPLLASEVPSPSSLTAGLMDVGYWILPKPLDLIVFFENATGAVKHKDTLSNIPEFELVWTHGHIDPVMGIVAGLAFCIAMLVLAGHQLSKTDY